MIKRIISGAQTGVDRAGLYAAQYLGLETGGFAPLGWIAEDGPQEELMRGFGMVECKEPGYPARTEANVRVSDATLIVVPNKTSVRGGSYTTLCCCESLGKLYIVLIWDDPRKHDLCRKWLRTSPMEVLNVAGPRASKWRDGQSLIMDWLIRVLE